MTTPSKPPAVGATLVQLVADSATALAEGGGYRYTLSDALTAARQLASEMGMTFTPAMAAGITNLFDAARQAHQASQPGGA